MPMPPPHRGPHPKRDEFMTRDQADRILERLDEDSIRTVEHDGVSAGWVLQLDSAPRRVTNHVGADCVILALLSELAAYREADRKRVAR